LHLQIKLRPKNKTLQAIFTR